jgi:hypothetical protein
MDLLPQGQSTATARRPSQNNDDDLLLKILS